MLKRYYTLTFPIFHFPMTMHLGNIAHIKDKLNFAHERTLNDKYVFKIFQNSYDTELIGIHSDHYKISV